MTPLRLVAVLPASDIDWSDAVTVTLLTADGLQVSAKLVSREDQPWISLSASTYQPAGSGEPITPDTQTEAPLETAERVEQINERVNGWAYRIPQSKAEVLIKRMDDLLMAPEED